MNPQRFESLDSKPIRMGKVGCRISFLEVQEKPSADLPDGLGGCYRKFLGMTSFRHPRLVASPPDMLQNFKKSTTYGILFPHAQDYFSLSPELLKRILEKAKPLGHRTRKDHLNLGFGFLYYGLVRSLRPEHIIVIGSGFGFSVVCLALACKDNGFGRVSFVDPSFTLFKNGPFQTVGGAGKWNNPEKVQQHFGQFGLGEVVTHYRMTSEDFFTSYQDLKLPFVEIGFIDGNHSYKHVRYDFLGLCAQARKNSYIFLHDTNIYIRETVNHAGVKRWLKVLKKHPDFFELIDFPFSSGVALVRLLRNERWPPAE
jgi:hypothetical protein